MRVTKLLIFLLWLPCIAVSQPNLSFGFRQENSTPVLPLNDNNPFEQAWAGGLNAPQFNELDINSDGLLDLVIFERTGNRLLTFRKNPGAFSYTFEPEWNKFFPPISNWLLLRDYNLDGKPDIFTSAGNGIRVYTNTSPTNEFPQFELFSDLLFSNYGNGNLNLFVSPVDIPAIEDLDGDGDLDILTFYILGTCVEYHQNLSVEIEGNSDTLIYFLESSNWGNFTESAIDNSINLNDSCGRGSIRHSGSSLLLNDFDKDGDQDLFLGDVSFPELLVLVNEPINSVDKIIQYPTSYPDYSALTVPLFPAAFLIHADDDNRPDLVIAPNTDLNSINTGRIANVFTNPQSDFNFTSQSTPFISHQMIDFGRGAYPVFTDLDLDGDQDLIVGNFGRFIPNADPVLEGTYVASIAILENIGNASAPSFRINTLDAGNLLGSNYRHLAPAAADLNGDSYPDLIVGDLQGNLIYLEQNPTNQTFSISNPQIATSFDYATPVLRDLNNDSKPDLLVGGKPGSFEYFENTGTTANPQFTEQISAFENLETIQEGVSNFGYSSPAFISYNDSLLLFSGSESGRLFCWYITPSGNQTTITLIDSSFQFVNDGIWSAPTLTFLNNDVYPELILGNRRGGLAYFKGDIPLSTEQVISSETSFFKIYPNPGTSQLNIRGNSEIKSFDLSIFNATGQKVFDNSVTGSSIEIQTNFSKGLYIIRITDDKGKPSFQKWIKQ
ncbi:MAG: T9SS type A sorting domain-containing protein [Bacteroidia bacterium]